MYFQKPGRKSEKTWKKILKILKTWKRFRKPGENFQKTFGHPVKNKKIDFFFSIKHFFIVDKLYLFILRSTRQ